MQSGEMETLPDPVRCMRSPGSDVAWTNGKVGVETLPRAV